MPATIIDPVEEQIHSTLNRCILKMSDRLLKTFDPLEKASVALFKLFCSALNARCQWLKSIAKYAGRGKENSMQTPKIETRKSMKESSKANAEPTWLEQKLKETRPVNPPPPTPPDSGLLYRK